MAWGTTKMSFHWIWIVLIAFIAVILWGAGLTITFQLDKGRTKMERLKDINEIDATTIEGRTLIAALATISCKEGYTDKTPNEILADVSSRIGADVS